MVQAYWGSAHIMKVSFRSECFTQNAEKVASLCCINMEPFRSMGAWKNPEKLGKKYKNNIKKIIK